MTVQSLQTRCLYNPRAREARRGGIPSLARTYVVSQVAPTAPQLRNPLRALPRNAWMQVRTNLRTKESPLDGLSEL